MTFKRKIQKFKIKIRLLWLFLRIAPSFFQGVLSSCFLCHSAQAHFAELLSLSLFTFTFSNKSCHCFLLKKERNNAHDRVSKLHHICRKSEARRGWRNLKSCTQGSHSPQSESKGQEMGRTSGLSAGSEVAQEVAELLREWSCSSG